MEDKKMRQGVAERAVERIWNEFDRRFQLQDLVAYITTKTVPVGQHSSVWYYFGGVSMFFFLLQIVTGILLMMYYQPGENTSYESMKYIVNQVPWGWLIRSTHCWSAHLMIVAMVIHMFSVFFTKAYRFPRDLTWYAGMVLLAISLTFGFSGYLLPWNELSYFATSVGTDSVKSIPVIGQWLLRILRGGDEVTINTLYRFLALHVCILPILMFAVLGVHLLFVQRQGMAEGLGEMAAGKPHKAMRFFPNFVLRDALLWIVCLNILAVLVVWFPYGTGISGLHWELGDKADPLKPAYPGIKPEWYFLWIYQLLREFPPTILGFEGAQICLLMVAMFMTIWCFIPLLDRSARHGMASPAFTDFGVTSLIFLTFLTLKAWDFGVASQAGIDPTDDPKNLAIITRICAGVSLGLLMVISLGRWYFLNSRFLQFSVLTALHLILHAFFGLGYVLSGAIVLALMSGVVMRMVIQTGLASDKKSSG